MGDIIDAIISAYKKYECPKNIDCENKHVEFWLQCMKTGIAEIEAELTPQNIKKEFADMAFIAIDGLYKMGYDPRIILQERLAVNAKKDMSSRNGIEFYRKKEQAIRAGQDNIRGSGV